MFGLKELMFMKENAISLDEFRLKLSLFDVEFEDVIVAGRLTGVVVRNVLDNTGKLDDFASPENMSRESFCFTHEDFFLSL